MANNFAEKSLRLKIFFEKSMAMKFAKFVFSWKIPTFFFSVVSFFCWEKLWRELIRNFIIFAQEVFVVPVCFDINKSKTLLLLFLPLQAQVFDENIL